MGALGGGGWEAGSLPGAAVNERSSNHSKKDKVLADMYEMFLDTLEAEVIECVVQSCEFNHKKSMDALMEMVGTSQLMSQSSQSSPAKTNSSTPSSQGMMRPLEHVEKTPPTQLSSNSYHLDEKGSSTRHVFPDGKKPLPVSMLSSRYHPQIENKQLPQPVNGYGRPRNAPGPPALNNYFPARKKKISDPYSGNEVAQVKWHIENGYRIMVLMRGCPGSGKSYLARGLVVSYGGDPKDFIFSTDDYFIRNNVYRFDPMLLNDAHGWNQRQCLNKAREGRSPIIIDNTNTQLWEMTVYATIAVNHGYSIVILEPETPWFENLNELAKRNKHGVPKDKIRAMLERYEKKITVEALLNSTGLKYTKPPPQLAEQSIIKLGASKIEKQHGSKLVKQDSTQVFSSKSSTYKRSEHMELNSASSNSPTGEFYFGPNTYKRVDLFPSNSGNQETRDQNNGTRERNLELFSGGFTKRFVPTKSDEQNLNETSYGPTRSKESDTDQIDPSSVKIDLSVKESVATSLNSPSRQGNVLQKDVLEYNFPLSVDSLRAVQSSEHKLTTPAVENEKPVNILEGEENLDSPMKVVSSGDSIDSNSQDAELIKFEEDCNPIGGSADSFDFKSLSDLKEKSSSVFSLSSFNNLQMDNAKDETVSKNPNALLRLSSLSDLLTDEPSKWSGSPDMGHNKSVAPNEAVYLKSAPKPPRSFSMKNIQDYCNSVKDMNAASDNEASSWSFSENSAVTWQPIEAEVFQKEKTQSPTHVSCNTQRFKFKKFDGIDKGTNTNHADFCLLSNNSSGPLEDGVTFLETTDRDINEGRILSNTKISLKLMLDKGTYTENDFEVEDPKSKSKQEKIKELVRLFPNRSTASIKELLKQCNWDLNYVSNILLDDTDSPIASFVSDENNDADSEIESSAEEQSEDSDADKEDATVTPEPTCEDVLPTRNAQEEAEEVKRHIEKSFDFNERCYSPHTLAIKNLRRGMREGAIPKTLPIPLGESEISTIESTQEPSTSDSSDEGSETLEFIVGKDFIQQLVDKFGRSNVKSKEVSPVVKFPVNLARQIYDVIFSTINNEDEEDDGDIAMKLQCEEDERMARQLYEEMLRNTGRALDSTPPQLREIMDMELAQAIYKADVDSLTQSSPDTIANVLAKRLLEENYSHIDKKTLHDIFVSCNCSFEDTVKTLQEALPADDVENKRRVVAQQAAVQDKYQTRDNAQSQEFSERHESIENSIGIENPWDLSDPKDAYNKYRGKADEFLKERDEMYRRANDAFRRKERSVAAYYSKLGEVHGKKFHHASAMAAAALAAAHTNLHSSDTLDLHHFKVVEAVTVFDLFMDYHIRILPENGLQQQSLDIITGRGTHSVNGKPRIKPAIMNRAKKRNLRCQQVSGNPGVLKIWVTSNSYLSHEVPE